MDIYYGGQGLLPRYRLLYTMYFLWDFYFGALSLEGEAVPLGDNFDVESGTNFYFALEPADFV